MRRIVPLALVLGFGFVAGWLAGAGRVKPPSPESRDPRLQPGAAFRLAHSAADGGHQSYHLRIVRVVDLDSPDLGPAGGNVGPRDEWRLHFERATYYAVPIER